MRERSKFHCGEQLAAGKCIEIPRTEMRDATAPPGHWSANKHLPFEVFLHQYLSGGKSGRQSNFEHTVVQY
jgi:hypothetical protein